MRNKTLKVTDNTIEVKDITISYDDEGNGAIPVILIHAFPLDKSSWQPQIDFLKKDHRVITYDIRGFGGSSAGNKKPSISLFADDLINFMDKLVIPKAIVCGLSMGGYIILNAVIRYPERFIALVLSDTQCIADTPEVKVKRENAIVQIKEGGQMEYIDGFIKTVFSQEASENNKSLIEEVKMIMLSTSLTTITGTLKALAEREEMCSFLEKILIPTLIICGKEDVVTPPLQALFMRLHIENSILQIIGEAGHMSNLEQAQEFNNYLNKFINSLNIK